ncbi:MAG: methyltransferase domain-containing protein, partial [Lentisphaerae bacterium]|nr:methyltransferase domain-containing protein [Lentisphaerota bacterium]
DGLEIGALHNPLPVSPGTHVKYVDRMSVAELRRQYPEFNNQKLKLTEPDIIDDGETLATIPDDSQDFLIANHFLEHCQNPMLALQNMLRVLRPQGVLYLAVPDMRASFDRNRPVTPLLHLERDYREGPEWSRRPAFEEYVRLVDKIIDPEKARRQVEDYLNINYSIHYHAWTETEIMEILVYLRRKLNLEFTIELFCRRGPEIIMILRRN